MFNITIPVFGVIFVESRLKLIAVEANAPKRNVRDLTAKWV